MNREIKFRAWSPKFKVMAGPFDLYPENDRTVKETYVYSETILMQYTGLKDKNGKDVFEGDVIRWKYATDNGYRSSSGEKVFSIQYNEGTAEYKTHEGESLWGYLTNPIEVIGNIYENPDLLT